MTSAPDATGMFPVVLGLLEIDGRGFAIDASDIREVVSISGPLESAPSPHPAVAGAIVVRAEHVPIVDLRVLLGWPVPEADTGTAAVILHVGGRLVGMLADRVNGLARVTPDRLQMVETSDASTIVSHSLIQQGKAILVIDAAALFAVAGVPFARAAAFAVEKDGAAGDRLSPHLLVRSGQGRFAIDAGKIAGIRPWSAVRRSTLDIPCWPWTVEHLGQEAPVFGDPAVLGLPPAGDGEGGAVVLLRHGSAFVGWRVDRVERLARFAATAVRDDPQMAAATLFPRVYTDPEGGSCLVLDHGRFEADGNVAGMAALCRRIGGIAKDGDFEKMPRHAQYLVCRAKGSLYAVPLLAIDEVIACAYAADATCGGTPGDLVVVNYCGGALIVRDLDGCDADLDPGEQLLLLALAGSNGPHRLALRIDALCSIVSAKAEPVPGSRAGRQFVHADVDGMLRAINIVAPSNLRPGRSSEVLAELA